MGKYNVLILLAATILACQGETPVQQLGKQTEKITGDLYKKFYSSNSDNIIFSGLSVTEGLSLISEGAKGDTQTEIIEGLSLPKDQTERRNAFKALTSSLNRNKDGEKIIRANKLFPGEDFSVESAFKDIAVNDYNSEIENVNYQKPETAVNTINNWVEQKTEKKITDLLSTKDVDSDTKLVLVNTIYFSGNWEEPFLKFMTHKGLFSTSNSETKEVEYMKSELHAKFRHCGYFQVKYLELDFKGGETSITFILPDNATGLAAIEEKIEGVLEQSDRMKTGYADVKLPKFKIETKLDLIPILKQVGVKTVFSDQSDLSGLSSKLGLKLGTVVQKAYINVNEEGVEAAAATGLVAQPESIVQTEFKFHADHPFLYYIRDKVSGAILFAGRFRG